MDKKKESLAVKAYIRYVFQRVKYLKAGAVSCDEDNMYQFYLQLSKEIRIWLNKHKIWAMFILKRIDFEKVKNLLGLDERGTFRFFARQRKAFIEYFTKKEEELLKEYPFDMEKKIWKIQKLSVLYIV